METTFLDNVEIEKKDLRERVFKLATFLESDSVELNNLSDNYKSILNMRTDDEILKLTIG
jgi:hypothetical protein